MIRNFSWYTSFLPIIIFIISCATESNIIPKYEKLDKVPALINCDIEYTGNGEYLPRTVSGPSPADRLLSVKYSYKVTYGKETGLEGLNLFNPLLIAGFPIGQDTLVIIGTLEIVRQGNNIKKYSAACSYEKTRSLFYQGPTFSELRRMGLLIVRDNIEAQMFNDKEFLSKLNTNNIPENTTQGGVK